ncbi:MAG: uroporphyrinogen-III synthase [Alistipes sp.]|nr:uroporphyrinogen-III synthase [Alistipes sp.]
MKIKHILVSQPTPVIAEKSPYHDMVLKHHVQVDFHPFIKLEGVSLKEFRSQRVEILSHSAVIFTSRVTIDHFFRICEEARIAIPEGMKYFCNTEAIALYLQKYIVYRKRKIFFADGTFSSLVELMVKHKEEKFLLTLSEPHKPEMPLAMEKLKLQFNKVILARTVSATDLDTINLKQYDLVAFYSPSEITALTSNFNTQESLPHIAAFGHGTAKAAIDEGLTVSVMAPTPECPSMTRAIDLYMQKLAQGEEVEPVSLEDKSPDLAFIESSKHLKKRVRPLEKAGEESEESLKKSPVKVAK